MRCIGRCLPRSVPHGIDGLVTNEDVQDDIREEGTFAANLASDVAQRFPGLVVVCLEGPKGELGLESSLIEFETIWNAYKPREILHVVHTCYVWNVLRE